MTGDDKAGETHTIEDAVAHARYDDCSNLGEQKSRYHSTHICLHCAMNQVCHVHQATESLEGALIAVAHCTNLVVMPDANS
jgi:hypothetical protein